jgi:hypothetical protein
MIELPLHRDAPAKPPEGAPCNGCGVCCAMTRCPAGWLFLPLAKGPCPALEWQDGERRYRCGLVSRPAKYLAWLPRRWEVRAGRWFASRIAAKAGCDCDAFEVRQPDRPTTG